MIISRWECWSVLPALHRISREAENLIFVHVWNLLIFKYWWLNFLKNNNKKICVCPPNLSGSIHSNGHHVGSGQQGKPGSKEYHMLTWSRPWAPSCICSPPWPTCEVDTTPCYRAAASPDLALLPSAVFPTTRNSGCWRRKGKLSCFIILLGPA